MDNDRVDSVKIECSDMTLEGLLGLPTGAQGLVLFAHGSGSGRMSPRNQSVARYLRRMGLATLLLDLLTEDEEERDNRTAELRFNIGFLAKRLLLATDWVNQHERAKQLGIGYFGASTGAAAALVAAAIQPATVQAVVSRGGRPDLAGTYLDEVRAPTLLIVGGNDQPVLAMNRDAMQRLTQTRCKLEIVQGATHLFEEAGALAQVSDLAEQWFSKYLHSRSIDMSHHV